VGGIVLAELVLLFLARGFGIGLAKAPGAPTPAAITNTQALGQILYTKYVYFFQGAGLVLLVAMVGAIVLTLRHKPGAKRQVVAAQVARGPKTAVEMVKVASGQAVLPEAGKKHVPEAGKKNAPKVPATAD
jgi:NADH-quinone oxidoreductase subunit J